MLNAVLLRRYPCPSCLGLGVVLPKFPDGALLPLTMGAWVTFSGSALNGPKYVYIYEINQSNEK